MKCPRCGIENDDDWPITVKRKIVIGGCQSCWEAECDKTWWEMVENFSAAVERFNQTHDNVRVSVLPQKLQDVAKQKGEKPLLLQGACQLGQSSLSKVPLLRKKV